MTALTISQRRWTSLGFALSVVLIGLLLTILITESRIGANAEPRASLAVEDIARALRGRELEVAESGQEVRRPPLDIVGRGLRVNDVAVEVYIYSTVAGRVADEQRWNDQIMRLTTPEDRGELPRITSVRNVLLLIDSNDASFVLTINRALSDLTG